MKRLLFAAVTAVVMVAAPARGQAHTLGNGYLDLAVSGRSVTGQLDLAFRDLHDAVGLDIDHDGAVRWREVVARIDEVRRYALAHIALSTRGTACPISLGNPGAIQRADGPHLSLPITAHCDRDPSTLTIDYRAIFAVDAQHRGILRVKHSGGETLRLIDHPGATTIASQRAGSDVLGFVKQGIWHIWIGVDHICFLLALLLPAVFCRGAARWQPAPRFAEVLRDVLDVVTAFTLAHSITLVVSAMDWLQLPVRMVETAIALSVAVAAFNNLVRTVDARWLVAFALGLLHGFGFSNVLLEIGLPGHHLVAALLGFNIGVELGQLAIVIAFLPIAFALRRTVSYRVFFWTASAAMCVVAIHWSIQRAMS